VRIEHLGGRDASAVGEQVTRRAGSRGRRSGRDRPGHEVARHRPRAISGRWRRSDPKA